MGITVDFTIPAAWRILLGISFPLHFGIGPRVASRGRLFYGVEQEYVFGSDVLLEGDPP